jgi:hypothetical protein
MQIDSALNRLEYNGTGLGLVLVKADCRTSRWQCGVNEADWVWVVALPPCYPVFPTEYSSLDFPSEKNSR